MGLVPFGLIYGASAKNAGLNLGQTALMSLGIFAGSSQLVFLDLWRNGVNVMALVLTVTAVNLRLLIYGSSLAPHLGPASSKAMGIIRSYFLTDESYAISMASFLKPGFRNSPVPFYLGAAAPTWLGWQAMGLLGYFAGSLLPASLPFAMAIPMVFLTIYVAVLKASRSQRGIKIAVALSAGIAAILLRDIPFQLGLIGAIFLGVGVGVALAALRARKAKGQRNDA
ncbi:MAG: AzlC family ABC transporter permease [Deltaproteobacteria bacterium]|jgi:predicted branched-subunit amino acid permease|nr:AzlC family ABC transporter permease [Deltaproteobacteria bacterium]